MSRSFVTLSALLLLCVLALSGVDGALRMPGVANDDGTVTTFDDPSDSAIPTRRGRRGRRLPSTVALTPPPTPPSLPGLTGQSQPVSGDGGKVVAAPSTPTPGGDTVDKEVAAEPSKTSPLPSSGSAESTLVQHTVTSTTTSAPSTVEDTSPEATAVEASTSVPPTVGPTSPAAPPVHATNPAPPAAEELKTYMIDGCALVRLSAPPLLLALAALAYASCAV